MKFMETIFVMYPEWHLKGDSAEVFIGSAAVLMTSLSAVSGKGHI